MLVRELIYSILDLCKAATSDDSFFTEEHVLFLCKKYRSFLLKKEQEKEKGSDYVASEFEYQEICLDLEPIAALDGIPCSGIYLRSTVKIPKILEGSQPKLYPTDYFQGLQINYVGRDRMRYVGSNPYLQNIVYCALGPDLHLYMNSSNPQFRYLRQLRMSALFEDFDEAAVYSCDSSAGSGDSTDSCDILDAEFPIREYLVPTLIELVVKELTGALYKPVDSHNNANDDLSNATRVKS